MKEYPKGFGKVSIPFGEKGVVSVSEMIVPEPGPIRMFRANMMHGGRYVPEGTYTALYIQGHLVMSDTQDECRDHTTFYWHAIGDILINGLGLGVCLKAILSKKGVTSVTVIEKSQDVIDLVAPSYPDPRVTIICADALEYKPPKGTRYDAVWHDIWPDICTDNLDDMKTLHRKYGQRSDWQGSWARDWCEHHLRREKASGWY